MKDIVTVLKMRGTLFTTKENATNLTNRSVAYPKIKHKNMITMKSFLSQGSCQPDSWLILVNGVPTCQLVPGNCTTDGQQIYWSPDPKVPEECHQLGQRGPCAVGQVVTRDSTGYISCAAPPEVSLDTKEGQSKNGHAEKTQNVEKSLLEPVSCPVGSHRSQIAKCPKY